MITLPALASCCGPVVRALRHRIVGHTLAAGLGAGGVAGVHHAYAPPAIVATACPPAYGSGYGALGAAALPGPVIVGSVGAYDTVPVGGSYSGSATYAGSPPIPVSLAHESVPEPSALLAILPGLALAFAIRRRA